MTVVAANQAESGATPAAGPRAALGVALLLAGFSAGFVATAWNQSPAQSAPADIAYRINPNTATRAELMLLPEIGPTLADNIIRYRDSVVGDAFLCAEDLDRVRRIGPQTVEKLRPFLTFSNQRPNASRAP